MKLGKIALVLAAALTGAAAIGGVVLLAGAPAVAAPTVEVWKSRSCGCCAGWITHMQTAGFTVKVHETESLEPIKSANGVPKALESCHTSRVDGYVIEGHVPANDIKRLLAERPHARGLAAPGMPQDAPGMDMKTGKPYDVVLFSETGHPTLYARH